MMVDSAIIWIDIESVKEIDGICVVIVLEIHDCFGMGVVMVPNEMEGDGGGTG